MRNTRWLNQSQPQTLVNACLLLYITAVFDLLGLLAVGGIFVLFPLGKVGAAWGIANERKWAYWLGIGVAALPIVVTVAFVGISGSVIIALAFDILVVVLLLHTRSREYQRIWFK